MVSLFARISYVVSLCHKLPCALEKINKYWEEKNDMTMSTDSWSRHTSSPGLNLIPGADNLIGNSHGIEPGWGGTAERSWESKAGWRWASLGKEWVSKQFSILANYPISKNHLTVKRGWEMTLWGRALALQAWGPEFESLAPMSKLSMAVYVGWRQEDPESKQPSWNSSTVKLWVSKSVRPCIKVIRRRVIEEDSRCPALASTRML